MLGQFQARHQRPPSKIVLTPMALLALTVKKSVAPAWQGVPVICREIAGTEATVVKDEARSLGVFVVPSAATASIVCCDLKT